MDKTSQSSDQYLKQLNKVSHKISKPTIKKPSLDDPSDQNHTFRAPATLSSASPPQNQNQSQHQPPVYNINKSDFRDVVQRLTGSPAHDRPHAPSPPTHAPRPQSTRLQRIRPPPLAHVSKTPPDALTCAGFAAAMSPLPPLPAVHASAESPVSAYMRFLHDPGSNPDQGARHFSGFSFSPLGVAPAPMSPPATQFQIPTSPIPFGCSKSQYPQSPRVPLSSPRWRDL